MELINPSELIVFGSTIQTSMSAKTSDESKTISHLYTNDNNNNIFECPEEGCVHSFFKYGNLMRHLAIGDHRKEPERFTLIDTAKRLYHTKLLTAENKRMISLSLESITFDSSNFDEVPVLEMGWGLPTARAPVRYTIKQKQFLQVSIRRF